MKDVEMFGNIYGLLVQIVGASHESPLLETQQLSHVLEYAKQFLLRCEQVGTVLDKQSREALINFRRSHQ